jgi:ribosomal protein S18 acetylase RimI-like enzyme
MTNNTLHTFTSADIPAVVALQQAYQQVYPGAPVIPGELYLSPAFHEGEDVFCASIDERLVAYAPVYVQIIQDGPVGLPHRIWTEIKAHPDCSDPEEIKDRLLASVQQRAQALTAPFPDRTVQMMFEYRCNEGPAVEFILARGFEYSKSVFFMRRDLREALPLLPAPEGISLIRWKMPDEAEQRQYIVARNECFPEAPINLAEWQYYMQSPQWAAGTIIAAFAGDELAGAVNVYWDEEENQRSRQHIGFTEDIFVRPAWRGKGIARSAIVESMRYLVEHGLEEAFLQVSALNQNALGLYTGLGYQVVQESRHYSRALS